MGESSEAEGAENAGGEEYQRVRFRYGTGLRSDGKGVRTDVEGSGEEGGVGSGSCVEQISVIRELGRTTWMEEHNLEAPAREYGIEDQLAVKKVTPEIGRIKGHENGKGFELAWLAGTEYGWRCG